MADALRPSRGGFLRPFGAAVFIREFLAGQGDQFGAPKIDPRRGAPQRDIHSSYKQALFMAMAEDAAARDAEEAIHRKKPMTPEEVEERRDYYLGRIPKKLTRMRYASFTRYFRFFIQLGYVERTMEQEGSLIGGPEDTRLPETTPRGTTLVEVPQPRVFYRLTAKGRAATEVELSDPIMTIYGYTREQRSPRRNRYYTPPRRGR